MTTITGLTELLKARNEQRLTLVREEFELELDKLVEAVAMRDAEALDDLGRAWGANAALFLVDLFTLPKQSASDMKKEDDC